MWRSCPPEVKKKYEARAEEEKRQHKAKYPGYRFQPSKPKKAPAAVGARAEGRKKAGSSRGVAAGVGVGVGGLVRAPSWSGESDEGRVSPVRTPSSPAGTMETPPVAQRSGLRTGSNTQPLHPTISHTIYQHYTLPTSQSYAAPTDSQYPHPPAWLATPLPLPLPLPLPPPPLASLRASSYPPPGDSNAPYHSAQPHNQSLTAESWEWHPDSTALAPHCGSAPTHAPAPVQYLSLNEGHGASAHHGVVDDQGHLYSDQSVPEHNWGRGAYGPRTEPVPLPSSGWPMPAHSHGIYACARDDHLTSVENHSRWEGEQYQPASYDGVHHGGHGGGQGW